MDKAVLKPIDPGIDSVGSPEVTHIEYDLWVLRIRLEFKSTDTPIYVEFDGVVGFRLLDEGMLLEMWGGETSSSHWLFEVQSNGWHDQERKRPGFISNMTEECTEYLVAGIDDCVSVLNYGNPAVRMPAMS